jgi:hypothetical protein
MAPGSSKIIDEPSAIIREVGFSSVDGFPLLPDTVTHVHVLTCMQQEAALQFDQGIAKARVKHEFGQHVSSISDGG